MNEIEIIEEKLKLLRSLNYVTAYQGSLDNLRQGTYVSFGDITRIISDLEKTLRTLKKSNK